MAERTLGTVLQGLPRRPDGQVDGAAVSRILRRRGRVHRFVSAASVPGGSGRTIVVPASGRVDRLTADTLGELDGVLGPPDAGGTADRPGERIVGGHVVALPYDLGRRPGATAFLEAVDAAVIIEGTQARAIGDRDAVSDIGGMLATAAASSAPPRPSPGQPTDPNAAVAESLGQRRFEAAAREALARIAAGDVYVVNLTQQLTTSFAGDVHELYEAMSAVSPAPHGAVIEIAPGVGIASVSPEAFLHADGRTLTIRPIKGTRPRDRDPQRDVRAAEELRTSEKERAENVMVVDLERNDLGQVCETGSVEVPELFAVEAHPTVWQLVSTVRGRLRGDLGYPSALLACSPCGSVTGAPKHSALRIIDELEPVPRGWYCGAVGWIGRGTMRTAVTIRTAVLRPDRTASYGTGAGIVADSDPVEEYGETRLKAAPFLTATGARWGDGRTVRDRDGGVGSDLP